MLAGPAASVRKITGKQEFAMQARQHARLRLQQRVSG
jgi:hypothetical protein